MCPKIVWNLIYIRPKFCYLLSTLHLMWPVLNVISKHSAFIFWLFKVYSTRNIWNSAEGSQVASWTWTGHKHKSSRVVQAVVRSQNGKASRDPFFFTVNVFHTLCFYMPDFCSTSLLHVLTPKLCSFLTTKLSGWALRIKPGPSQPCFCIVTATENFSDCSLCYFDFILQLFQLLQRYCLYFSKGFWPILQYTEKWPQGKNLTPTFRENYLTITNAGGGIGES